LFETITSQQKDDHLLDSLEESEQKYQVLFEQSNDAIFILQDDMFVDCNKKATELFRGNKEKILNQTLGSFYPGNIEEKPEIAIMVLEKMNLARAGTPQIIEMEICRLDKSRFIGSISLNTFNFSGFTFLQAIIRDKTEEINSNQQLLKLTFAVENSPVFIMMTDANGKIEYINSIAIELTGIPKTGLLGMSVRDNCFGGISPEDCSKLWETLLSGKTWHGDFHLKNSKNTSTKMLATISPIRDNSGDIVNFIGIMETNI